VITINRNGIKLFNAPRLFFTLKGQSHSEAVLESLKKVEHREFECCVFESAEQVRECLNGGISPNSAVVLFDYGMGSKCFTYMTPSRPDDVASIPKWSCGAQWAVKIGTPQRFDTCARQLSADFGKLFTARLKSGWYPWGQPRKKEKPPVDADLGKGIDAVIKRLNSGPDLAASMAANGHALELPPGSKISWIRVPSEPVQCDLPQLRALLSAFKEFEQVCDTLVRADSAVQRLVMAGVDVDPSVSDMYLFPSVNAFSLRRPDFHVTESGVFASENDEMPGGFAELVHIDEAYGINQQNWKDCFDWLFEKGPVLFLISHEWSKCYITEFKWLVDYLNQKGYHAVMRTTDHMEDISITDDGVWFGKNKVGTIWRQFPIFETRDKLAAMVRAAHCGSVRMVPEFAHYGNKVWFSVFRSHHLYYRERLLPESFALLDEVLPESHVVISERSFPCRIETVTICSLSELKNLGASIRDDLVLKICGANTMAARSYGVLVGHGLSQETWTQWINERIREKQPFIIQKRLATSIASIPVMNTKRECGEMFDCRVLLRPWAYNGNSIASVSGCAVPSNTLRVHGRVDMAIVPVSLS